MQYPFLAACLLLLLTGCAQQSTSPTVKVREAPAQGLTQHAFDQGYLQNLAEETREAAERNLVEYYERGKTPASERHSHARTSGRYELLGKHRLAVIDLSYSGNPMRVMRIVGIEQDRLITISCISPRGEPQDLRDRESECGRTVNQHFPTATE